MPENGGAPGNGGRPDQQCGYFSRMNVTFMMTR